MACFRTGLVVFGLVLCMILILKTGSQEIRVGGDDFVAYNLSSIPWLSRIKKHSLMLDFKTVHPSGLLVYIGSELEQADFVMLDLVRGKLRITVNLGDDIATPTGDLVLEDNLADNYWHTVKLRLVGRQLNISLRGQKYHTVLNSKYSRLNINAGFAFAGGVPQRTLNILQGYKPSANLRGCLRDVFFDKRNILAGSTKADGKGRVFGSPENICRHANFATLSFQNQEAYLFLPSPTTDGHHLRVKMQFRTYFADGILAVKGLYPYRYVGVSLVQGKMFLQFRLSARNAVIQLSQGEGLNDGEWHGLSAVVGKAEMKLQVDQLPELRHENPLLKQAKRFSDLIFIGGYPKRGPNFFGCIHDLHVDDEVVDLDHVPFGYIRGTVHNQCNISSHCFPNPCLHCGTCSEARSDMRGFSCNCQRTFYRGPHCERPIYLRTCQEYKNLGLADDAYCKVDSDAEGPAGPLKVLCNVTDENQAVSLLNHNKIGPQLVESADVNHEDLVYIHYVKYPDDLEGIKALIAQSDRCRQFVSFRCFGTKLMHSPVLWGGGSVKTVNDHWPGAPAGSGKCACGVNGTCADPRLPCNCDIGDQTWREDKGYVTDKANLPVTLLQFPLSAAQSYFTVGPLECFGTLNNNSELSREMELEAARFFNSLCRVVNPTTTDSRPSTSTPDYTEQEVWSTTRKITTPAMTANYDIPATKGTKLSTTVKAADELSTSGSLTDLNIPSADPSNEVTQPVSEANTYSESSTTSSPAVFSSSVTHSGTLALNNTQTPGDSNGDLNSFGQDESTGVRNASVMSWQLAMAWALLIVLFVMVVLGVGYIVKKRRGWLGCGNLFGVKKKKKQQALAEVYGFPEVRLRSRSGELDLSDIRRSIEAGSYNVRSGAIAYGESFYM